MDGCITCMFTCPVTSSLPPLPSPPHPTHHPHPLPSPPASRPPIESFLDTYFQSLPDYQGTPLDDLRFKRILFGAFPAYPDGPLRPAFDRVVQAGDAAAMQSPLVRGYVLDAS